MLKVIVINGAGTSGKDTFIDLFSASVEEEYKGNRIPVFRFSSVDKVKEFARHMGWDGVKDDKGRRFLSDIKDALTRYNDAPFNHMVMQVAVLQEHYEDGFVFFHVREPSEIEKMVKGLNATTLLIQREGVQPSSFDNHADKNVFDYSYDYIVDNNGTLEDLQSSATTFLHSLVHP